MRDLQAGSNHDPLLAYVLAVHYLLMRGGGNDHALHQLAGARGRFGGLTAACFLLYRPREEKAVSVNSFIFETAPILIQQLSRRTHRERVTLEGRISGKVDWSSTFKARHSEEANPAIFVCLQNSRLFERPENHLFKFMLDRIRNCLDRVPSELRGWQLWRRGANAGQEVQPLKLETYLETLAHHVRVLSGHISLREVRLPTSIKAEHLVAARASKNHLYSMVADLYELYRGAVETPTPERWLQVVAPTLPLPPGADEVGHLIAAP